MNKLDTVFEVRERISDGRTASTRGLWDAKAKTVVIEHTCEPYSLGEFTETVAGATRTHARDRAKLAHHEWVIRLRARLPLVKPS